MKICHVQEDFRRLTDGTCVDSHGHIITFGKFMSALVSHHLFPKSEDVQ